MNQPPSRLDWLTLPLLAVYTCAVGYAIFMANPKLMLNEPLAQNLVKDSGRLQPVPNPEKANGSLNMEPGFMTAFDPKWQGRQDGDFRTPYNYKRSTLKTIDLGDLKDNVKFSLEQDSAFVVGKSDGKLIHAAYDGGIKWQFTSGDDNISTPAIVTGDIVFIGTKKGRVYALNRQDGSLLWTLPELESVTQLLLKDNGLFVTRTVDESSSQLLSLKPHSGEIEWMSRPFEGVVSAPLASAQSMILVPTSTGQLYALSHKSGELKWTFNSGHKIAGAPTVVDETIYVANQRAQALAINAANGEKLWEYSLSSNTDASFVYLPAHELVAILTDNGYLHAIDRKTGTGKWKFNTHNESPIRELTAFRLTGRGITKFELAWRHQGWTLWSPCAKERICIYNPDKGQLIARIYTKGKVHTRPVFLDDKNLYVITENPEPLLASDPKVRWALTGFEEVKESPQAAPPAN